MMTNRVLVVGGGGREHALAFKLSQSQQVSEVIVSPGNPGCEQINKVTTNSSLNIKNHQDVINWCKTHDINLVVVGPEDPLAKGLSDDLQNEGISCFGPTSKAARLESSKHFAKCFMQRYNIPTAKWESFTNAELAIEHIKNAQYPALIVKASGLAAGKGVLVNSTKEEACDAVCKIMKEHAFGSAGETVIIEELLVGEEISVLSFCDGETVSVMPPSQDHKRLNDGDVGPNTGGMGAYCPCPQVDKNTLDFIHKNIILPTIEGMKKENCPFVGVLYTGLILTTDGPKVLEFNCRFGDPEAEVILPLLKSDLYLILDACVNKKLKKLFIEWEMNKFAVGIVMASKGYPASSEKGQIIIGFDKVNSHPGMIVFQAGTSKIDEHIVTNGGRVLIVVATGNDLEIAAKEALKGASLINFSGAYFRHDIGYKGIKSKKQFGLAYIDAGVSIASGNELVEQIKPLAKETNRIGVMGSLGGFGGLFELKPLGYRDPVLVSGTDGVGTKLKVAQAVSKHDCVGIDLVAMCVNDILAHGAEPLFFLDYFACDHLNVSDAKEILSGITNGCKQAGCALLGGETAEMPGMYKESCYEIAGFSVGIVERQNILPKLDEIQAGDCVIGISSSGLHSNGFSLVRKVLEKNNIQYQSATPYNPVITLDSELMIPTKIYVKAVMPLVKKNLIKGIAHITGGGLLENIPRILPDNLGVELDAHLWNIPPIFRWLQLQGNISDENMLLTFNCGIGMILIIDQNNKECVLEHLKSVGETASQIGFVIKVLKDETTVRINNFSVAMQNTLPNFQNHQIKFEPKKVAVLISGSGTNLQSLIDSTSSPSSDYAKIVLVISNVPSAQGLKRAEAANIPTKIISHKNFQSRAEFDMALHTELKNANVDIVCLAGFMRILTGEFVRKWEGKMINIHPSLLPSFKGANSHKQVLAAGARVTGCTVHFVVEEVDAGGIILQEAVPVKLDDTEETLQERVKNVEHRLFPKALELLSKEQIEIVKNKVIWNI